jgi:transcriptional regulator with XRE-family HTH domain
VTERRGFEVLASNLHRLVFERGTTLDEVARAAGLTREQLDAICAGEFDPDLEVVYRIAHAVGVSASELIAEPEYH